MSLEAITDFQVSVARRWIHEAGSVEQPHFKFVAYFGAVNALYWLWGMADEQVAFTDDERKLAKAVLEKAPATLRNKIMSRLGGLHGEAKLIDHLIDRIVSALGADKAANIVIEHADYISFWLRDRRFLFNMNARDRDNPAGDPRQADKYLRDLEAESSIVKLKALGGLLYILRCNLVHGSKETQFDQELIARSVPPLKSLADAALEATTRSRPT